jgi:hypothetical protein
MSWKYKIKKLPEGKKNFFAVVVAIVVTIILVVCGLKLNRFLNELEGDSGPSVDTSQFNDLKDTFQKTINMNNQ